MRTRDSLGVFFEGEETDGFLVYAYWQTSPPVHPLFPTDLWAGRAAGSRLFGVGWTILRWNVAIDRWPEPHTWIATVRATLERLVNRGARLAWFGLEGHFADPPLLFEPSQMSGGVWAVFSPETGFLCDSSLDKDFLPLADDILLQLRRLL